MFPSAAQLKWQRWKMGMFVHFGVNTFTDREWGDGTERPSIFNPTSLDARQWARAARVAGCNYIILTAKHHDGFCLWPSKLTDHSVKSSPWRGGNGDVVKEFVDAARAEGLAPGLYLSPWDRHEPKYGSGDAYNEFYLAQLTELLTNYGQVAEVWFDGANGEGPNGKKQAYDWPKIHATVRKLQPDAVMFSDAGPDIRWIGNEKGTAGDPNWCTVDPAIVTAPGMSGTQVERSLQHGDAPPAGTVWRPGEADVSMRPGWFHHPAEDAKQKTVDALFELYLASVGRNANLLLNVPPTKAGLLHATDVARLAGLGARVRSWLDDGRVEPDPMQATEKPADQEFARPVRIGAVVLEEYIERGQGVSRYRVEAKSGGAWTTVSSGTTIGRTKIDRIPPQTVSALRLVIESSSFASFPLVDVSAVKAPA